MVCYVLEKTAELPFEYPTSEYPTSESLLFRCFRYSDPVCKCNSFLCAGGAQSNVPAVTGEVVNGNVVNNAEIGAIAGAPGHYLILLLKTGTVGI